MDVASYLIHTILKGCLRVGLGVKAGAVIEIGMAIVPSAAGLGKPASKYSKGQFEAGEIRVYNDTIKYLVPLAICND